jgi:hypothetical protein
MMPEQCATFLNKKTTERGHWSATGTSFAVVAKIWAQRTRRLNLHVVIRSAKYPRTRLGSPLLLLNIHSWSRAEATKQTSTVYNMSASIEASTCTAVLVLPRLPHSPVYPLWMAPLSLDLGHIGCMTNFTFHPCPRLHLPVSFNI